MSTAAGTARYVVVPVRLATGPDRSVVVVAAFRRRAGAGSTATLTLPARQHG